MLDCGFSGRETSLRLARLEREAAHLTAILLTHEHTDHLHGVGVIARKYNLPVWMTPGTWRRAEKQVGSLPQVNLFNVHEAFAIDDVYVEPYPVPHDASDPSQFVFSNGSLRLGVLTDTGSLTRHIETMLSGCDGLILECNHDRRLLREGPYPEVLKERVGGPYGHLDNDTAAKLLASLDNSGLQHVVAAHMSETNNTPFLVCSALALALNCDASWIQVADQAQGLHWRELS